MPYFRVLLEGNDIDIPVGDGRAKGFWVSRFVRSASAADAGLVATKFVAREWSSGRFRVLKATPRIVVSEVERIGLIAGIFARQPGYAFHEGNE